MNTLYAIIVSGALVGAAAAGALDAFEDPPIAYSATPADNPISQLQAAIDAGTVNLAYEEPFGYLPSLLSHLGIPVDSQLLVFSKTSFQNKQIGPTTPRAIYFNDDVYIGTVQHGEVLEISSADPNLGAVFYTLPQQPVARPEFVRERHNCLQCHATTLTRDVPGHIVRSVFPATDGQPILKAGSLVTDQTTPFEERWGGWYITGTHGEARHRGNSIARETDYDAVLDVEAGANHTALPPRVDTTRYLAPHSDIVAMMVLEHQTQLHNLMTQASFETRMALHRKAITDRIFERDPDAPGESVTRVVANVGDKLVDYLIFAKEAELEDPVQGTSNFTRDFEASGPRDGQGRSLREFDLDDRLFTYPLSYLIYSPQFDGLPELVKAYVYQRLWNIFSRAEPTPHLLHLTNAKCRAVIEILVETKPDLPDYWVK